MKVPASHILVLLSHRWPVGTHVQQESASDPGEIVLECQTVLLQSSQLEPASIYSFAFPTRLNSIHKAGETQRNLRKNIEIKGQKNKNRK